MLCLYALQRRLLLLYLRPDRKGAIDENALIFQQVRSDIQAENFSQAEELLDGIEDHCAEWYFLKGAVYYRKGWMDEAQRTTKPPPGWSRKIRNIGKRWTG